MNCPFFVFPLAIRKTFFCEMSKRDVVKRQVNEASDFSPAKLKRNKMK